MGDATKRMPWWAAPGFAYVNSAGELVPGFNHFGLSAYPATKVVRLPENSLVRKAIRFGAFDIEEHYSRVPVPVPRRVIDERLVQVAALKAEQGEEEKKVGLPSLNRVRRALSSDHWTLRNRLGRLALDHHSPAALVALALWEWAEENDTPQVIGDVSLASIRQGITHTSGKLREHARFVVNHPKSVIAALKQFRIPPEHRDPLFDTGLRQLPAEAIAHARDTSSHVHQPAALPLNRRNTMDKAFVETVTAEKAQQRNASMTKADMVARSLPELAAQWHQEISLDWEGGTNITELDQAIIDAPVETRGDLDALLSIVMKDVRLQHSDADDELEFAEATDGMLWKLLNAVKPFLSDGQPTGEPLRLDKDGRPLNAIPVVTW